MGTNNFHYQNTSQLYALECEEELDYENHIDYVEETFESSDLNFIAGRGTDTNELRSFPSKVVGTVHLDDSIFNNLLRVTLTIVVRSGYYQHACLDYCIEYEYHGETCDDLQFLDLSYTYNGGLLSDKMIDYQTPLVKKRLTKLFDRLSEEVEKIFGNVTTSYKCLGSASNGETFYEKA